MVNPLAVALDTDDRAEIDRLVDALEPVTGMFKIGLTAFTSLGPEVVPAVSARRPVFLDLKLHDIPAQVTGAVDAAGRLGAGYITVHASGGPEMLAAAAAAAAEHLTVLAVTILTSLDDAALARVGFALPPEKAVLQLADLAVEAGLRGLVCSPLDVAAVRGRFGSVADGGPLLVVPGIRPGAPGDDQRRTSTARAALEAGADILVVGRPITRAADPAEAARRLLADLRR
ncbi:MAG: orotidine-5'-phosphate decarboxylase [Actinomycetota bacterium]